jgi:hypothetical protein
MVFEATPFLANAFRSASPILDRAPTHVAITYSDTAKAYAVYLNGVLDASGTVDLDIRDTSRPVHFGLGENDFNHYVGSLDEIRFWNVVRTPDEILAHFAGTLSGTEAGLAGYWNFDAGTAADASPNGHHGAVFGDAAIAADDCRRPVRVVAIDIKPDSTPATINVRSRGVIPVAILSTDDFDAHSVDPQSLSFGPGQAPPAHDQVTLEDVNGDGRLDLMLHFPTPDSQLNCGDTTASIKGMTTTGEPIEGTDVIRTVGCR